MASSEAKLTLPSTRIEMALSALTTKERTCLILREQKGMSVAEIAEVTGLGIERTRAMLFLARERLRTALKRQEA